MDKVSVIVNPVAGGGQSAKRWQRLQPMLQERGLAFEVQFTEGPGDGVRLAAKAAEAGATLVVAVGGDGTASEAANGLMLASGGSPVDTRLGILPTGRGSDLCRTVGIPLDATAAVDRILDSRTVRLDLGIMEYSTAGGSRTRYFTNFAGMGFDVEVTQRANASRARGGGTIPYLSAVIMSLYNFKNKRVELVLDGEVSRRTVATIVVANGQYFGGGMRVAPQASPTDGQFDVVILADFGRLEFIRNLPRVYEGSHVTHPKVEVVRARQVEVHSVDSVYVQVDGDPLGETPARVRVLEAAIPLVV